MLTKENLAKDIIFRLSCLETYIKNINAIGLFDANLIAEDFFANFLSILHNSSFLNANLFEKNYTSIDLINDNAKIAVQVTSENSSTKIKETVAKFIEKEYYKKYINLRMLLLQSKKNYTKEFDTQSLFSLEIWDFENLFNEIRKNDVDLLKRLYECVEKNINISELIKSNFASGINLCTEDIKNIIDVFCKYKKEINIELDSRTNYNEYPGITDKNKINNLSEEYYKHFISPNLSSFQLLDDFLKNPRNDEYLEKYYDVATDIKGKLLVYKSKYNNFEEAINLIYDIVTEKESIKNKRIVYLLLQYMYCQCDIGKNVNA